MIRFYLSDVATAPFLGFYPVLHSIVPGVRWSACDGRPSSSATLGKMLVMADVTNVQHAALLADARITYFPFERADGSVVGRTELIGEVSLANRTALRAIADAHHVPLQGITLQHTVNEALGLFRRRYLIRQILRANDFSEGLDTLVSAVPLAKRQAIAAALQAQGFDTSVIVGSDTVREAIRRLAVQNIPFFQGV